MVSIDLLLQAIQAALNMFKGGAVTLGGELRLCLHFFRMDLVLADKAALSRGELFGNNGRQVVFQASLDCGQLVREDGCQLTLEASGQFLELRIHNRTMILSSSPHQHKMERSAYCRHPLP